MKLELIALTQNAKHAFLKKKELVKNAKKDMVMIGGIVIN
jgi:hypothetical protein